MTPHYSWILFDADGTLFDYDRAEHDALSQTLAHFGVRFAPEHLEIYRDINGRIWRDFEQGKITQARLKTERFALFFAALGLSAPPDPAAFSEAYLATLGMCTELIGGALEVITALQTGYHLALITNGIAKVQRARLSRSPIGQAFEVVVISEEVGASKPDPRIFEVAFERMGRPSKEQVLLVGDSLTSDIAGGRAYGIDTVWVNPQGWALPSGASTTYEIRCLEELAGILAPIHGAGS